MPDTDRAQTTFDFAVGITLFLLVVGFAFSSVPGFIAPYEGGQESESLLADRTADQLVTEDLTASGERYRLERSRVDDFFGSDPAAELAVGEYDVYVTLNSSDPAFTNRSAGDAPRENDIVSRSRRVVSAPKSDGTRVRADLTVRVWQ